MKVYHVTPSISSSSGGVGPAVLQLAEELQKKNASVTIFCHLERVTSQQLPETRQFDIVSEPPSRFALPGGSRKLSKRLRELIPRSDIVHCNCLWESCLWSAASIARSHKKPYLVSPHGMFDSKSLQKSKVKKKIVRKLFVDRYISEAACLQATAVQEARHIRNLGFANPIAVVPIGLDTNRYVTHAEQGFIENNWPSLSDKQILLFMSRVHLQKGLINLTKAWGSVAANHPDWHLVIAGPDSQGHEAQIREAIEKAGVAAQTLFAGPVYGEHKKQLLAVSDVFVLPSFSESFGIVITEALASGKPVITTKGTHWSELQTHNCGWWIDIGVEPLEAAMIEAMNLSDSTRQEMGQRGRKLIEQDYSWPIIAAQMLDVYKWILGEGKKPSCVEVSSGFPE